MCAHECARVCVHMLQVYFAGCHPPTLLGDVAYAPPRPPVPADVARRDEALQNHRGRVQPVVRLRQPHDQARRLDLLNVGQHHGDDQVTQHSVKDQGGQACEGLGWWVRGQGSGGRV